MKTEISMAPDERAGDGRLIERFIRDPDVRERHEVLIRAPAELAFDLACKADMQALPVVRAVFKLRERLLGARPVEPRQPRGMLEEVTDLGWGMLALRPGREVVMGAVTRPWEANVVFRPIPPEEFAAFAGPNLVKIVWTLEAEPLAPALTRLRTETRVVATDEAARRRFRRYWRLVGMGVVLIRMLLLAGVRRQAEERYRLTREAAVPGSY